MVAAGCGAAVVGGLTTGGLGTGWGVGFSWMGTALGGGSGGSGAAGDREDGGGEGERCEHSSAIPQFALA